jgi:hypothetical protein
MYSSNYFEGVTAYQILALTMGLNTTYDSFVISLDSTPTMDLTLNYIVHHMLNEEVCQDNHMKEGWHMRRQQRAGIWRA